jgi:hypothetical protein
MTKPLQFGLVAEGDSRHSEILRLPRLAEDLGPVKSNSLGSARKLCNFLRAGYAVAEYEELQAAKTILVRVPDDALPSMTEELLSAGLMLSNLSFVLCESWLTTDALAPLRDRGAAVATVIRIPSQHRSWFIVEGQPLAVLQARRLLDRNDARALEIRPGTKSLYFAAELLATALPMPLLIASQQALRATGITAKNLTTIVEEMLQELVRGFSKGGRTNWGGPLLKCSPETAAAHLEAVRSTHPQIADAIDHHLPYAQRIIATYRHSEAPTGEPGDSAAATQG